MWCDNCLLVLPLRAGAIAWATVIFLYSLVGSIFLLRYGQFWFFTYPEWQVYGGIGLGVAVGAALSAIALSNRSYLWTKVVTFIWPFIIVIAAIRAIIMIVRLQQGKAKIQWECDNGGQLWDSTTTAANTTVQIPSGFCAAGFSSLNTAIIVSLLIDLAFQLYMFFLTWRFMKRLEHYRGMKGPFAGGYYNA